MSAWNRISVILDDLKEEVGPETSNSSWRGIWVFSIYIRLENHNSGPFSDISNFGSRYQGPGVKFQKSAWHPETYIRLFSSMGWVDWCEHFSDRTFLSQVTAKNSAKVPKGMGRRGKMNSFVFVDTNGVFKSLLKQSLIS